MSEREKPKSLDESVEAAILDADLFVKYKAPQRAIERLQEAITHWPRSIVLREKLREVAFSHEPKAEPARSGLSSATYTSHARTSMPRTSDPSEPRTINPR